MPGFPAGITEGDQAFCRADAVSDGEQDVLGRRQGQLIFQINGRLETLPLGVKDEAAIGLHRAADEDRHMLAERWRFDFRA
ncbi:hypothetical protein D3C81_2049370 [compost metagenome]